MSPDVLMVSEEKLKSFTTLNFNISPNELTPFIFDAQQIYLQNYLGATYIKALKQRIQAGTLTDADETLLDDYIGPMLCNWALYMSLPFLKYRMYNKGILSGTSENGESIGLDELQFLMNQAQNIAENFTRRMQEWLFQHSDDYPLWNAPDIKDGQLPDKGNNYYKNLVTPHYPYAYSKRFAKRFGRYPYDSYGPDCYNLPTSK